MAFPPCPITLKPLMHYLKVAQEHDERNPVVAYWCRLHALQVGIKLCSGRKNKDETLLLAGIMDWLETAKKSMADNEAITNEVCAQAAIEEYVLKIFRYADEQDRAEVYNKNLVKAFYTCSIVMEVLAVFGDISEDIMEKQKYAKWKAAYIHNCLKNGERPVPGPLSDNTDPEDQAAASPPPQPPNLLNFGFQQPPPGDVTPPVDRQSFDRPTPTDFTAPDDPFAPMPSTSTPTDPATPPAAQPQPPAAPFVPPPVAQSGQLPALTAEQVTKAQKYCKWASSALNYDDSKTAVLNLQKALQLLQTGSDPS